MSKKVVLIRINFPLNRQSEPLGLAYLGATLIQKGWQVRLIDAAPLKYSDQQILAEIGWRKPEAVCLTSTTPEFPLVAKLAQKIKNKFKLPIIIGGSHATAAPKETLKFFGFDFVVLGEGEETLPQLLQALWEKQTDFTPIKGIAFKKGRQTVLTPRPKLIANLDQIPFPARHLLPHHREYSPNPSVYRRLPMANIFTSRGCPYQCIFCDHSVFGWQIRFRSPENVVEEMEILKKDYGVKELRVWDDTFNLDSERVIKICKLMIKKKLNLSWTCQGRVDFVSQRFLTWIKKAGCWQISYGIESGSEKILKLIDKGITKEMVLKAVKLTKRAGLEIKGFFVIGFPQETAEDIQKTLQFSQELPLDYATFSIATPFIGTKLYKMLPKKEKITLNDFQYFDSYQTSKVFFTQHIKTKEILDFQKQAYRQFYLRPSYWLRQIKSIKSRRELILKIKSLAILAKNT